MFKVPLKHPFAFFVAILLHGWVALLFLLSFEWQTLPGSGDIKMSVNLVLSDNAAFVSRPPLQFPNRSD